MDRTYINYHHNGEINEILKYKNKRLHGEYTSYFPNGQLKNKCFYNDGLLEGKKIILFSNGNVYQSCNFLQDRKEGIFEQYDKDKNIEFIIQYVNNKCNGNYFKFKNNKLEISTTMKDNMIHGVYTDRYENGNIRLISNYDMGLLHGEQLVFNSTGLCIRIFNYYENKLKGYNEFLDAVGLKRIKKYENGEKTMDFNLNNISDNDRNDISNIFKKPKIDCFKLNN